MGEGNNMSWYGVDLDGTLAKYDRWEAPTSIGEPIDQMVNLVGSLLDAGKEVRIFTARVSVKEGREEIVEAIEDWCEALGLGRLRVTNEKDFEMIECYDDRSIQVMRNEGFLLQDYCSALMKENQELKNTLNGVESITAKHENLA